jgi:8-oxo-dGTP diphosphatase
VLVTRVIEGREHEACANDDFVLWHDPKVAAAVVVESDGGVVLGRRAIEPAYGMWCLPGGFVNDDEHPAEAAVRECREEICAEVELTGLLCVYHVAKQDASSIIGVGYRARLMDGVEMRPGEEMLEVAAFPVDALPPLAFSSHREVIAEYLKSRARTEVQAPRSGAPAARRSAQPSRAPEGLPPRRKR